MPVRKPTSRLTPARRRAVDRLLDEILDLEPHQREQRLACIGDRYPRIHAHLARLVEASEAPTRFLDGLLRRAADAAIDDRVDRADEPLPSGTRIGDWRLIEPAGAGGMGQVYRAERADGAFELHAAIKFIRTRHNAMMAERLAIETRLLARLNHPNIARILDGGTLPDGQNYLVMEWIDGEDLSQCRDRTSHKWTSCLHLFRQIAAAAAHAHQRGVVHGDIKPANVRIAADGRPQLLDFGVARLISQDPEAPDAAAAVTPAFCAPEQLAGEPASTQSDIYALGALLGWMFTGRADFAERPATAADFDTPRRRALAAVVRNATAPEPADRYASVPGLIDDIDALAATRPVAALPYGAAGRLALWARRHQLSAALAGLTLFAVLAAGAGVWWQARIAAAERDAARFEAQRSAMLREQLVMLFREVGQNTAGDRDGRELTTRELLTESAGIAERMYADDPQMQVNLKAMLGEIHIAMNDFTGAEPLLAAFVEHKPNLASPLMQSLVRADLAQIRLRQGRSEQALALLDDALEMLRRRPGENSTRIADVLQIRGQALRGLGRWDEAVATLEESLAMARSARSARSTRSTKPGPTRLLATINNNLATTLMYAGRSGEAMAFFDASLENWRALGLEDGSSALTVMGNLAGLLHRRGDLQRAETLYREAIERRQRQFGDSGALGALHLNLGSLLAIRHRIDEARSHVAAGVGLIRRFEGPDSVNHAQAVLVRGRTELAAGEHSAALKDFEAAERRFGELVGPEHLFVRIAGFYRTLAAVEAGRADPDSALTPAVAALEEQLPASAPYVAIALCEQARLLIETDPRRASDLAGRCLELRRDRLEQAEWRLAEARAIGIAARIAAGENEALAALRAARAEIAGALGENHPMLAWCDRWLRA